MGIPWAKGIIPSSAATPLTMPCLDLQTVVLVLSTLSLLGSYSLTQHCIYGGSMGMLFSFLGLFGAAKFYKRSVFAFFVFKVLMLVGLTYKSVILLTNTSNEHVCKMLISASSHGEDRKVVSCHSMATPALYLSVFLGIFLASYLTSMVYRFYVEIIHREEQSGAVVVGSAYPCEAVAVQTPPAYADAVKMEAAA